MAVNGLNPIAAAQEEVNSRRRDLERIRNGLRDTTLADYARLNHLAGSIQFSPQYFTVCRTLSGHNGKIYAFDWSERDTIVSASQDGRLIVWNARTRQKTHAIKLQSQWVMACAISSDGQTVVSGGLDNLVSVFRLRSFDNSGPNSPPTAVMQGHKGYISFCRFVPNKSSVLTSSGDYTSILWDLERATKTAVFGGDSSSGHSSNVTSLSIHTSNPNLFVTGSCDNTAKLWDVRASGSAKCTFSGHGDDINAVQFMPDGHTFGTGSDDGTCKLFDIRYGYELQEYQLESGPLPEVSSIAFSSSGRILVASYTSAGVGRCYLWDVLTARVLSDKIGQAHSNQISQVGMVRDGSALCTGSWDCTLKVWAYSPEQAAIHIRRED